MTIDSKELQGRVAQLEASQLETARLLEEQQIRNRQLQQELLTVSSEFNAANDDLFMQLAITRTAQIEIIRRLSLAAEYKDTDTADHLDRMSHYSALIGEAMGMGEAEVENLLLAAPMHDVGKIGVPDNILLKPGKLTEVEHEVMRQHTVYGARILGDSESEIIQLAHKIAIGHHEKWNGGGYPNGIEGNDIPIESRIVYIADLFDALTSRRPYKDPYPVEVALEIVNQESGLSLDPQVTEVFNDKFDEILELRQQISPEEDLQAESFTWSERDQADGK